MGIADLAASDRITDCLKRKKWQIVADEAKAGAEYVRVDAAHTISKIAIEADDQMVDYARKAGDLVRKLRRSYAALRAATRALQEPAHGLEHTHDASFNDRQDAVIRARRAIAKATGVAS